MTAGKGDATVERTAAIRKLGRDGAGVLGETSIELAECLQQSGGGDSPSAMTRDEVFTWVLPSRVFQHPLEWRGSEDATVMAMGRSDC